MAVLSVLVGSLAFIMTKDLQKVSRTIMKENVTSLKAAEELELALLNQKGLVSNYFLDGNSERLGTLEERKKDFDIWYKNAQQVALTAEENRILQDISNLYRIYDDQRNEAVRLYQDGKMVEAKDILFNEMQNSIESLYQRCEDLILANEALIVRAEFTSQKNVFRMTTLIWAIILIVLCLGVIMGFFIARRISEQLVKSAKLASLGQLSANVAHEIRNPLTAIKMRIYSLHAELSNNTNTKEDLNVIGEEIDRMEKIVKNFLDFARPPEPHLRRWNIHQVLEGAVTLLLPKAAAQQIVIQKNWNKEPVEVEVDREQIRQAFLNILLNAVEAMPKGGVLEVSTFLKKKDSRTDPVVTIEVRDTGSGISSDLKERLFEPFVTTKEGGTGLGLFIASRIIQMHQGKIEIGAQIGKGTVLSVELPVCSHRSEINQEVRIS